jgi:esterase/lipase superfamily enzyme
MADRSRGLFTAAFTSVREAVPADRLVLAAHSLGAQLVGETVQDPLLLRTALVDAPVRAMAFLTPDVSLARFRDSLVPALRPLAARRVLYVSRADRALTMARLTRHSERAGLRTTEWLRPAPHLMESVDVTQALTTEGWFQRRFGTHHAIKRQTGLLIDLIQIVGARRSVDCRAQARLGALSRDSVWVLRRVSPHADSLRLCAPYPPSGQTP